LYCLLRNQLSTDKLISCSINIDPRYDYKGKTA
jgi:hypothetical protein